MILAESNLFRQKSNAENMQYERFVYLDKECYRSGAKGKVLVKTIYYKRTAEGIFS